MSDNTAYTLNPFKLLGAPETWHSFGDGEHDADCDAERRSLCDHFLRRIAKLERRGNENPIADIVSGGSVAFAGLFIAAGGGIGALPDDAFDRWIAIMTFAWYQAVNVDTYHER